MTEKLGMTCDCGGNCRKAIGLDPVSGHNVSVFVCRECGRQYCQDGRPLHPKPGQDVGHT
jgi:hypothetical protein